MTIESISTNTVLRELFPQVYQEEATTLIAFLEAYYAWMEDSEFGQAKKLLSYRDIDTTLDDFIIHFKNKYLVNLPMLTQGNIRNFIKHSDDFYDVRGTEEGIKLLFNLLYDTKASVYKPGSDIIKASDGEWYQPVYLEVSTSQKTKTFVDKEITGASSQAKAYVESIIRKVAGGQYYDVMYLSNIRGEFKTGERVTDGTIDDAPIVIGSLNRIDIIEGGRDNNIGDLLTVISQTGRQGLARVSETFNGTGRVDFTLVDGGTGYTVQAESIVSNTVLNINTVTNADPNKNSFIVFETIEQPLSNIEFISSNNTFAVGDTVEGYTAGTFIKQASGRVVQLSQSGTNGHMLVSLADSSSEFAFASILRKAGNTVSAVIDTVINKTATANVIAQTSNTVGIFNINNTFFANVFVRGITSNTYAKVASLSQGSGAKFSVGTITNEETVLVHSDIINGLNSANVPYLNIKLNGEGSGLGLVDSIVINAPGTGYTNGDSLVFSGGGQSVTSITINAPGTGYANGERLVFTSSTGSGASGIITTNSGGAIVSFTMANTGAWYSTPPTVSVNTASGTSANLVAVLDHTSHPDATITTNGAGGIVSIDNDPGTGYFYTPNVTAPGGTGANLSVIIDYGYGFPKNPAASNSEPINSMLSRDAMTIGTIATITGISPGQGYNQNPFARVIEPRVASINRKNIVLELSNVVGSFIPGEVVTQNFNESLTQLAFSGIAGNTGFEIGEKITQGLSTGLVYYRDSGVVRLADVSGTFVATTNTATQIISSVTNATANVTTVAPYSQSVIVRGIVDHFDGSTLNIKRASYNTNISTNTGIIGIVSDTTANVVSYAIDYSSEAMGNNAIVDATVRTANGIASAVEVIDSGFGYRKDDIVELRSPNNDFVITGRVVLEKQGKGKGFWKSTRGFLNSDKYIHDGRYYQAFSYEIRTSLSFDYYSDIVKKLLHVSGTEMFGKTIIESETEVTAMITSSYITQT